MRISKLSLQAFGPYIDKCKKLFIDQGIFLISGPTGSGKTSILDAISFAFYGLSVDGLRSGRELRAINAASHLATEVTLHFTFSGIEYKIWRQAEFERPKKRGQGTLKQAPQAKLWRGGDLIEYQYSRVSEAITRILGLRFSQFRQTIILPQGEFRQLLILEGKQRQFLLETIFETHLYQKLETQLKESAKALLHTLEKEKEKENWILAKASVENGIDLHIKVKELESQREVVLSKTEALLKEKKNIWSSYEKQKEKLRIWKDYNKLLCEKNILLAEQSHIEIKRARLEKAHLYLSLEPLVARNQEIKKRINCTQNEIDLLQTQKKQIQTKLLDTDLEELQEKILKEETLFHSKRKKEQLSTVLHEKQDHLKRAKKAHQKNQKQLEDFNQKIELSRTQLKTQQLSSLALELQSNSPCPLCGSLTHPSPAYFEQTPKSSPDIYELEKKAKKVKLQYDQSLLLQHRFDVEIQNLHAEMQSLVLPEIDESELFNLKKLLKEQTHLKTDYLSKQKESERLKNSHKGLNIEFQKSEEAILEEMRSIGLTSLEGGLERREREKLESEIRQYDVKLQIIESQLFSLGNPQKVDEKLVEEVYQNYLEVEKISENYLSERNTVEHHLTQVKELLSEWVELNKEVLKHEQMYSLVGTLAELAQGKNPKKLSFNRYVLSVLFEEVLLFASLHLEKMTQRRYTLQRDKGLDLYVFDHYLGQARPISTLSGGESFQASLSLALGLSDAVQKFAGGRRLETLFIDEGFGSLDPYSLDLVMSTLDELSAQGRVIGIISHLEELRERIPVHMRVG